MNVYFNRTVRTLLILSGLSLAALGSAFAQQSATASADASATIIQPIAITKTSNLVFGNYAVGATGGSVSLSTADVVSVNSGTISQPASNKGSPAAAVFAVSGEGSFTYAITLPSDGTVSLTGAGAPMPVTGFTSNPATTGTLSSGTQNVKVGATLNLGSAQAPGAYTGTFAVTVAYN
ncbi:DUF4402 domain-containing protein [Roseateles oligotrophus]|uniref:DUF4402 domain-containing protein n=1 Tax=Roseateles oligotrophus TaxID=1769250 RepID=A0ABT2YGV5_9BURK|nr:DUF4402 domain-containing protein [Roseateles oligotrophus]MCV2369270.1 DUF4402 domain-containing protein [Roseateles oligotrophus]